MFDECYQSFAFTVQAMEKHPNPTPAQAGWAVAFGKDVPVWEYHSQHEDLGVRTSRAMVKFTGGYGHDLQTLVSGYDWSELNSKKAFVVDMGGASGHTATALCRANPNLRFEVQDLPDIIAGSQDVIPKDLTGRVEFKVHDFLTPQKTSADAYVLRQILHDWPDAECVKILKALTPALKPGAKIICNDTLVFPPGKARPLADRHMRAIDNIVMSLFNGKEREMSDWERLFKEADSRYTNIKAWQPENSAMAIVEVTWSG